MLKLNFNRTTCKISHLWLNTTLSQPVQRKRNKDEKLYQVVGRRGGSKRVEGEREREIERAVRRASVRATCRYRYRHAPGLGGGSSGTMRAVVSCKPSGDMAHCSKALTGCGEKQRERRGPGETAPVRDTSSERRPSEQSPTEAPISEWHHNRQQRHAEEARSMRKAASCRAVRLQGGGCTANFHMLGPPVYRCCSAVTICNTART